MDIIIFAKEVVIFRICALSDDMCDVIKVAVWKTLKDNIERALKKNEIIIVEVNVRKGSRMSVKLFENSQKEY